MPGTFITYEVAADFTLSQADLEFDLIYINTSAPCVATLPDAVEGFRTVVKNSGVSTLTINKPDATLLFTLLAGGEASLRTYSDNTSDTVPQWQPFPTYAITNVSVDRAYDANATTTDELADTLGTLIADLRAQGIVN